MEDLRSNSIPSRVTEQSAWQLLKVYQALQSHLAAILARLHLELPRASKSTWAEASLALAQSVYGAHSESKIDWARLQKYWALTSASPPSFSALEFAQLRRSFELLRSTGTYFGSIFRLVQAQLDSKWLREQGWRLVLVVIVVTLPLLDSEAADWIEILERMPRTAPSLYQLWKQLGGVFDIEIFLPTLSEQQSFEYLKSLDALYSTL